LIDQQRRSKNPKKTIHRKGTETAGSEYCHGAYFLGVLRASPVNMLCVRAIAKKVLAPKN